MALTSAALGDTRAAFDRVAPSYDAANTANPLLSAMRQRALTVLSSQVAAGAQLLELGCGPGTDSIRLVEAGYGVTAIDWSPAMVAAARARATAVGSGHRLSVHRLGIHELDALSPSVFDAAFSNLGPLNCVPDIGDAARQIAARLRHGGVLVASVIGRVCPWEIGLYLARGDRQRAALRFAPGFVAVPLAGGTVWTRYYSPSEFEAAFAVVGMTRVNLRTLGLFAPPPYLEHAARRHRAVSGLLQWLDDRTGSWPGLRHLGDHFLITLRKH